MAERNIFARMDELHEERQEQFDKLRAEFRQVKVWICWMGFGFVIYYIALLLVTTPEQILALATAWVCWIGLLIATSMD